MMKEVMERLLNEGSPSIAYRIKKEIKQEKLSKEEEQNYLDQIYAEPKVQMVLAWQNEDGFRSGFGKSMAKTDSNYA